MGEFSSCVQKRTNNFQKISNFFGEKLVSYKRTNNFPKVRFFPEEKLTQTFCFGFTSIVALRLGLVILRLHKNMVFKRHCRRRFAQRQNIRSKLVGKE